jgi:hypothetical protein
MTHAEELEGRRLPRATTTPRVLLRDPVGLCSALAISAGQLLRQRSPGVGGRMLRWLVARRTDRSRRDAIRGLRRQGSRAPPHTDRPAAGQHRRPRDREAPQAGEAQAASSNPLADAFPRAGGVVQAPPEDRSHHRRRARGACHERPHPSRRSAREPRHRAAAVSDGDHHAAPRDEHQHDDRHQSDDDQRHDDQYHDEHDGPGRERHHDDPYASARDVHRVHDLHATPEARLHRQRELRRGEPEFGVQSRPL